MRRRRENNRNEEEEEEGKQQDWEEEEEEEEGKNKIVEKGINKEKIEEGNIVQKKKRYAFFDYFNRFRLNH